MEVNSTTKIDASAAEDGSEWAYLALTMQAFDLPDNLKWMFALYDGGDEAHRGLMFFNPVNENAPLQLFNDAQDGLIQLKNHSAIINGNDINFDSIPSPANLIVGGNIHVTWNGSNTERDGLTNLLVLSANNSDTSKVSDVGFQMINAKTGLNWKFRTGLNGDAFVATKDLTGGAEFRITSATTDYHDATMEVGGVTVFENGHLVTASSRSLKTNIEPLDTQAAMNAFHQLQPVSYEYKAQKGEPVVGFIAEDVPDLVAMPSRKSFDSAEVVAVLTKVVQAQDKQLKIQEKKIKNLERMQKRLAKLETLLTNLALDTSKSTKEKVTLNK